MAYDQKTYGKTPFVESGHSPPPVPTQEKTEVASAEALSDQIGDQPDDEQATADEPPALPDGDASTTNRRQPADSIFHIPIGRISGLNLVGEALGWLMAWGTVGFFRAYLPAAVVTFFDRLFTPWGMASGTLLSALLIGQLLERYRGKIGKLRRRATVAIEYGESHHRADAQTTIDRLLSEAEAKTEKVSRWLVSWLTALGCLFIIGAFY